MWTASPRAAESAPKACGKSDGCVLSVREQTGPSLLPAAAAMAAACATAWWTASARALPSTWAGSPKENVRESICAASPDAFTTPSIAAPADAVWRSVAVTVFVTW